MGGLAAGGGRSSGGELDAVSSAIVKLQLGFLFVVVVLAASGSSFADSGSVSSTRVVCGPPSAQTLGSSSVARVYAHHVSVYGCSKATRKQRRLGSAATCRSFTCGFTLVEPVAVAGELAAYGVAHAGVDTSDGQVVVRRLTDGQRLRNVPATNFPPGEQARSLAVSIVLRSDGAVAWIGEAGQFAPIDPIRDGFGEVRAIEVHEYDKHGPRRLDSGLTIRTHSLRLHGSTLTWKDGAATRSATLR